MQVIFRIVRFSGWYYIRKFDGSHIELQYIFHILRHKLEINNLMLNHQKYQKKLMFLCRPSKEEEEAG